MGRSLGVRPLLAAAVAFCLLVAPIEVPGAVGDAVGLQGEASAGVKKKVKRLSRQVKRLKQKVRSEQGSPRPPTGAAGGDLTGDYPDPALGDGVVDSANVADSSLLGADINPGTTIDLSGANRFATLSGADGLFVQVVNPHSGGSTEVLPAAISLFGHSLGRSERASLSTTEVTFRDSDPLSLAARPGESSYGETITLPEAVPDDDPPEGSALLYVREEMGLTQLVARFADGSTELLAAEGP